MASLIYDRQRTLDLRTPASATIVGAGGVGFWVATFLTMSGVPKIVLYDPDVVEPFNLNRLALSPVKCGQAKVDALREWLISLRPEAVIIAIQARADGLMVPSEVMFDCTDDYKAREPLFKYCQANGVRYFRVGYDGNSHITVANTLPWQIETPVDRYAVVPSWVVPAVLVAVLGVYSCLSPEAKEVSISGEVSKLLEGFN